MVLNFALAGRSRIDSAFNRLRHNPGYAVGIVLGSVLALQMSLVWGGLHTWAGWHRMRARLLDDGFVAFGEVLAPAGALHDFRDGIWRGLWRVHGGTIGFIILQMPIVAIIMLPSRARTAVTRTCRPLWVQASRCSSQFRVFPSSLRSS